MPTVRRAWTVPVLDDTDGPTKRPVNPARILDLRSRNEAGPEFKLAVAAKVALKDDPHRPLETNDVRPAVGQSIGRLKWMISSLFARKSPSTLLRSSQEQGGDHHAPNFDCRV
jgi:hypothetical protein